MIDFKREERYVVLKLKHMTSCEKIALQNIVLNNMEFAIHQKPCVVVESDWPIYDQTWDAIQRIAENRPQKIEELEQQLAEAQASNERLNRFAERILLVAYEGGDIDGASIQEAALAIGIVEEIKATKPCGEFCQCAEYADFPTTCFRKKNETPKQSLAHHNISLIEKVRDYAISKHPNGAIHSMSEYINQLREGE